MVDARQLVRADDHRGVDQMLLVVVAVLARGAALAELPAGRRLVGQRAARQIELGLLPALGVLEAVVIEAERQRVLLARAGTRRAAFTPCRRRFTS